MGTPEEDKALREHLATYPQTRAATRGFVEQAVMPSFFPVWAEENSTLGASNTYEWAFGNGANTPAGGGLLMSVPYGYNCVCYAMGIKMNNTTGSATVELLVNGVPQGPACNVVATATGGLLADVNGGVPLAILNGDLINFRTSSSSGTAGPCVAVAWFMLEKEVVKV